MLLKRNLVRRSWAMEAIVEAVCKGRGSGSLGRRRSSLMDHELVTNSLQFSFEMAMSFATIGPRSRRDRATIVVLVSYRSPSDRLEKISLRQLPNYGSIAPRSRSSSTHPQGRPMKIVTWWKSDAPERSTRLQRRPSDRDRAIFFWWRSDAPRVATWRQVRNPIASLTMYIKHVLIWWSRGLGSTRS